jgi:flagellar biosynthesis component FlhA
MLQSIPMFYISLTFAVFIVPFAVFVEYPRIMAAKDFHLNPPVLLANALAALALNLVRGRSLGPMIIEDFLAGA